MPLCAFFKKKAIFANNKINDTSYLMTTLAKPTPIWQTDRFWLIIYFLVTLFVSAKEMFFEQQPSGMVKVGNNNFTIFYQSFHHLWEGKTLYGFYEAEYQNRYNYSPFFAVVMLPFSLLPYTLSGLLWNVLNGLFFFSGLRRLHIDQNKRVFLYWFLIFEAYTSLINFQTNPSLTSLAIWTVVFLERGQLLWGTCLLMLGVWIKLIGIVMGIFWLMHPKKIQFALYCVAWSVVFFLLPLLFVSFEQLLFLYREWYIWLTKHTEYHGGTLGVFNAHAFFKRALGLDIREGLYVVGAGVAVLGAIAVQRKRLDFTFKMLMLANMLIFMVIFSPGAESPTYIIALTGVAIWYIYSAPSAWHIGLAVFAFILTGLSQSDLFPAYLREHYTKPYSLKALPCLLVWIVSVVQMYRYKGGRFEG